MLPRRPPGRSIAAVAPSGAFGLVGPFLRAASNLALTNNLIWTMIAISAAGAIVTFSFLVYSIWRFRDPKVKGRRYG